MLRELHIENFALIQELTVAFSEGLNILTGETGAGKSIIIDALNQVLGERASSELVRSGEEKATVSAVADVGPELRARLAELGLETQESTVVLQRDIYANSRSQARIDGRPVSLAALREVGALLVEIHGQQENHALQDESSHLALVDAYGGRALAAAREEYSRAWRELTEFQNELAGLHGDKRERERLLDLLKYQVDEIEQAGLAPGEDKALQAELKLLQNSRRLLEVCRSSHQSLGGEEEEVTARGIVAEVLAGLKEFRQLDGILEQASAQLEESLYSIEDAAQQLRSYADSFFFDPRRQNLVEERLTLIYDLKRKYGDSVEVILAWQQEKKAEIEAIRNTEARHAQLLEKIEEAAAGAGRLAQDLSLLRQKAGEDLAAAVVAELAFLQMAKTRFQVHFSRVPADHGLPVEGQTLAATGRGIDEVFFLVSPNPGEPLKPLVKIASGGEMSRIMLAILNVLAQLRSVHTMIFDEIDAGIGGRAAQAVAEKLAAVAVRRQVICVSHLPQIASLADTHFFIRKGEKDQRTLTEVDRLEKEGRVEELARMLGGAKVTAATREHAREMLALAKKLKENLT